MQRGSEALWEVRAQGQVLPPAGSRPLSGGGPARGDGSLFPRSSLSEMLCSVSSLQAATLSSGRWRAACERPPRGRREMRPGAHLGGRPAVASGRLWAWLLPCWWLFSGSQSCPEGRAGWAQPAPTPSHRPRSPWQREVDRNQELLTRVRQLQEREAEAEEKVKAQLERYRSCQQSLDAASKELREKEGGLAEAGEVRGRGPGLGCCPRPTSSLSARREDAFPPPAR